MNIKKQKSSKSQSSKMVVMQTDIKKLKIEVVSVKECCEALNEKLDARIVHTEEEFRNIRETMVTKTKFYQLYNLMDNFAKKLGLTRLTKNKAFCED